MYLYCGHRDGSSIKSFRQKIAKLRTVPSLYARPTLILGSSLFSQSSESLGWKLRADVSRGKKEVGVCIEFNGAMIPCPSTYWIISTGRRIFSLDKNIENLSYVTGKFLKSYPRAIKKPVDCWCR